MRTVIAFRRITMAAVAGGLAVLTACSSGASGSIGAGGQGRHASAGQSGSGYDSVESITRCFRQHGDPGFPDPVYDPGDGRWHFGTSPNAAPMSARQACQNLFPVVNPSPPVPQAQFQALVRLAECIRQHGEPHWPDPNPQGEFPLPPALLNKTPASEHALSACRSLIPGGRSINVIAAP